MGNCCQGLVARSFREGDSSETRQRKDVMFKVSAALACFGLLNMTTIGQNPPPRANFIGNTLGTINSFVALFCIHVLRSFSLQTLGCICFTYALSACLIDVSQAAGSQSFRAWTWVVLVMDMYLTFNVSRSFQRVTLGLCSLWIVVSNLEQCFRLGLFDIKGVVEDSRADDLCDCANPPCAAGAMNLRYAIMVHGILYGDYFITRRFAEGMRVERDRIAASVEVADQVVACLANLDLDEAREVLRKSAGPHCNLPKRLVRSFHRLVRNLSSYRPYLPQTCFEDGDEAGPISSRAPSSDEGHRIHVARASHAGGAGAREFVTEAPQGSPSKSASGRLSVSSTSPPPDRPGFPSSGSSSGGSNSPRCGRTSPMRKRSGHAPQLRRVTLLARNTGGFLTVASPQHVDASALGAWLAEEVERFEKTIRAQGGVTDIIQGDHFNASFGTIKAQGSQHAAATRAARELSSPCRDSGVLSVAPAFGDLRNTTAVCSGRALCGDFGSIITQRFMVIGGVSSLVNMMERVAASWGTATLIDSAVHRECEQFWSCRLRKCVKFSKMETSTPIGLWEVLAERLSITECAEWMYDLANAEPNPWARYNEVILKWCTCSQAIALELLARDDQGARSPAADDALQALREAIQQGAEPPICVLDSAALVGEPSLVVSQGAVDSAQPQVTVIDS